MVRKKEIQTKLSEYRIRQVGINATAHTILRDTKNELIKEHGKNFTFSDAIVELKNKANGVKIKFTEDEILQIKNKLHGI